MMPFGQPIMMTSPMASPGGSMQFSVVPVPGGSMRCAPPMRAGSVMLPAPSYNMAVSGTASPIVPGSFNMAGVQMVGPPGSMRSGSPMRSVPSFNMMPSAVPQ